MGDLDFLLLAIILCRCYLQAHLIENEKPQAQHRKGERFMGSERLHLLMNFMFKPHIVGNHCDKFAISWLATVVLNGITKIGV